MRAMSLPRAPPLHTVARHTRTAQMRGTANGGAMGKWGTGELDAVGSRGSRLGVTAAVLLLGACGQVGAEGDAGGDLATSTGAAESACGWDPQFGLLSCTRNDWWPSSPRAT